MSRAVQWVGVAAGGAVGTALRWGVGSAWPVAAGTFPFTTLMINLVGSALIGVVIVLCLDRDPARPLMHSLLGTGLLGGFTTFSTFAVESTELLRTAHVGIAAVYVVGSVVGGLVCALAAMALTRRFAGVAP